jgi:penicillin-binding protein A
MLIALILTVASGLIGLSLTIILVRPAWRARNPRDGSDGESDSPASAARNANGWLRGFRSLFLVAIATVFAFHCYWVFWADSSARFTQAKRLDARNRRLAESGLKGWVFDRTGKLENALIRYRSDAGYIRRDYPLGPAAVHLTGYSDFVFGAGGMEFALRDWLTEAASISNRLVSPTPVGKDIKTSIDSSLQREVFNLVQGTGKAGAAIVLLLPSNEVLALASAPSFDASAIADESTWMRMSDQAERAVSTSPLVDRALGTLVTGGPAFYYRPGSTFKTFIAAVAIDSGITDQRFVCKAEGFTPPGSGRPIRDFGGESHGIIGLKDAFRVSCNQYFAQLGLKLGRDRLAHYAQRLLMTVDPNEPSARSANLWSTLHGDRSDFDFIFAPPAARMNLSSAATSYDLALQSIGQGYDDVTVMFMALMASATAGVDGALIAPTFELGAQRKVVSQFISAAAAATLRGLMRGVVESGTASGGFGALPESLRGGGKTGTADRDVPVYDSKNDPVLEYRDKDGRAHYRFQRSTDAWFIGYAPADDPRIAFAIVVENGGQGARVTVPIAARIIQKAAALGYVRPRR